MEPVLEARQSGGGAVQETGSGEWRLSLPAGDGKTYRWAQLDDYMGKPRGMFPWRAPVQLNLRARVSDARMPGTWGFGFWNDPFSASLGIRGMSARLPALPNTAWFFYAAPPNYLAFRDDHPAQGFLAATFAAPRINSLLLAPGALALPLLALRPAARLIRRLVTRILKESGVLVPVGPTQWHAYQIDWREDAVTFRVDETAIAATSVSPRGPLGLVLWIDNQYAAFSPSGRVQMGVSPNSNPVWLEIGAVQVEDLR